MGNETIISLNLSDAELEMLESMKGVGEQASDVVIRIIKENIETAHSPECTPFLIHNSDLQLLAEQAVKENKTAELYFHDLIKDRANNETEAKMAAVTLEMVWSEVTNDCDDIDDVKRAVAGELIVARAGLELATKGKIEPEQIKKWAEELYT